MLSVIILYSHDFHWGCVQPSLGRRGTVKRSPVGVMGVRKQSMHYRCLQLAWWRLEYNPLWGKGILAGPLHSALMWTPFDFLFIFLWFFEQRFPHFSMEGFWKTSNTLENTNVFAGNNVKAWEQTYLPIVAHSAVTSTSLNKSNGKRLCRKISLLRNKCDAMIAKSYGAI